MNDWQSHYARSFWDRFPGLLMDDPEDPYNELIALLRQQAQFYFDDPEKVTSKNIYLNRSRQPTTVREAEIEVVKNELYNGELEFKFLAYHIENKRYVAALLNVLSLFRKLQAINGYLLHWWRLPWQSDTTRDY